MAFSVCCIYIAHAYWENYNNPYNSVKSLGPGKSISLFVSSIEKEWFLVYKCYSIFLIKSSLLRQ